MFMGCSGLVELKWDNGKFNTSAVTNMSAMFSGCKSLQTLDVSNFNTSQVKDMGSMFSGCSNLTQLDVSHFDTSTVSSTYIGIVTGGMSHMFSDCSSLTELDVSHFDTSNVVLMSYMFNNCSGLKSLDISNFKTGNTIKMDGMFYGCSGLSELDVSKFDTAQVKSMAVMFYGCSGLSELNVSNFNTSNVTDMGSMFSGCESLQTLDVSNFNTSSVTVMSFMFSGCSGLLELDVSRFDTSQVMYMTSMFSGCKGLQTLDISSFNFNEKCYFPNVFEGCSLGLKTEVYHAQMGGSSISIYNKHRFENMTDSDISWYKNLICTPYVITPNVTEGGTVTYSGKYGNRAACDTVYQTYFVKTAPFYNEETIAPEFDAAKFYAQDGEDFKISYTPLDGYAVTKVVVDDININLKQYPKEYTMKVTKDMEVSVTFTKLVNVTLMTGNVSLRTISSAAGEKLEKPADLVKTGYIFAGWYKEPELLNQWDFDNDILNNEDINLYAKWIGITYNVTLYPNGGTIEEGEITGYTCGEGAVLPTKVTKTGYTFGGWYDNPECTGYSPTKAIFDNATGDKTFYAKWNVNSYWITLYTLGGSIQEGNVTKYTYGQGAVLPTNVTRAGYTFAGWYDNSGFTGNPTAAISTTDTGDKTFYAKWNDTQKPVLTVSQPPKDWKAENVTLTLSYSDNEGVTALYSRMDDGSYAEITDFTAGSYQYTVSVEGEHTYTFKAVDAAGNAKETAPVTVKLDKSAPQIGTITFDSGHQSFWQWIFGRTSLEVTVPVSDPYSGADHISWVLTPAGKMAASPKTAAVTNGTAVFTVDSGFKGEILITAYDKVGNSETADVIRAALEDHQPVISVTDGTKPFTGDWYDAPQMIHVEVTDGEDGSDTESGLHTVVYTVDDNLTNTPLFTRTEGELVYYAERSFSAKEGDHTYHITAADNAGNSVTIHVTVKQDTTPPVVTELTADKAGEKSIGITFTSDDTGTYHYLVRTAREPEPDAETVIASNSADIAEAGAKVSFTADGLLPNTEYVLYLVTVDKAGNKGTVQSISFATEKEDIEGTVVLDDTAPRYGDVITVEAHLTGSNPGDLAFQWYRGDEAIDGAVKHSYTVTKDDVGESLSVKVSAENYKDVLCSAPMDPVGKRQLTVTAEAEDKIYDGTADAVISLEITEGKIDGDDVTAVGAGSFSDVDAGPEKTVVLSDIALEGADKSYYELKSQPDNPKADIGKMAGSAAPEVSSVDETYPGASDGKITGLTAGLVYEISSDNGVTWEDAVLTGTEIRNLRAGAYQVRIKESTNSLAGEMTAVTIGTTPPVHAPVPQTVFDAFLMTLAGTSEGMQYSLDGGITWIDITHGTEVKLEEGITEENGIYVRQKGNGTTLLDSLPQMITITKSPVPEGIISVGETGMGLGDGKLKHVTPDMEYRKDGENVWRSCEGTEITVNPGVYYVRMKGKGTELASEEAGPYVIQKYETKAVTGIKMDVSSLILAQGASFGLTFTLEPADATDRTVVWSSSNPSVAAVAEDGSVSALHIGTAVITVKAADGGWSDSCRITVKAPGGVNGIVKDDYGPVEGATVEAREGGTDGTLAGKPAVTGADGRYIFNNLPRGIYSLVAKRTSAEGKLQVITRIIKITDEMEKCDIFMPAGDKNTIVEVKADTPPVAVDYLDELFLHENLVEVPEEGVTPEDVETVAAGGSLEIKLLAEKKERKDAAVQEDVGKIEESAGPGTGLLVLDLAVEKTVREAGAQTGSTTRLKRLPELIKIVVPIDNLSDKERIRVLRVHGGETQELPLGDEYFEVDENNLILYVNQFSIYAVAYDEEIKVSDGEKERTSDSKWIEGTWILDEVGWWYDYGNRLWPSNGWYYLPWRKEYYWYHFNKTGYIDTGWFTDTDGKIYYLHPYHDGSQGYMYTGWNFIDGNWYYFETKQGKEKGMLYVNRKTPDGYLVDASGAWVQ